MVIDLKTALLRISRMCHHQGVDCLATRDLSNIRYLTGFSVSSVGDAVVLILPRRVVVFSDSRYEGTLRRIEAKNPLIKVFIWDRVTRWI